MELGIKEIGPRTLRFAHSREENASYQKSSIKVNGIPLTLIARTCGIEPKIDGHFNKPYRRLMNAVKRNSDMNTLFCSLKETGVSDSKLADVKNLFSL